METTRMSLLLLIVLFVSACSGESSNSNEGHASTADRSFPAASAEIDFMSAGSRLNGLMYQAAGAGPHPTAVLLHGLPGNERNLDLAQALRRGGMNVLYFNYRGSWGSGGSFSLANAHEDVRSALTFVRDSSVAAKYRIDPSQIILIGHSMGGWLALRAATTDAGISCVAALESWDIGNTGLKTVSDKQSRDAELEYFNYVSAPGAPLQLAGTGEDLLLEMEKNATAWRLTTLASSLNNKTLLLLDAVDNETHAPFVAELRRLGNGRVTAEQWPTDHSFNDRRNALAEYVVGWVDDRCLG